MEAKWKRGYPKISIVEAIEKAKQIYDKEYNHPAPREVMASAMGYSGINGASSTVLSALSQYGLIESAGEDMYKISDDTLNLILHQRGEPERVESVRKLTFNPGLFSEMREKYPNNIPSDENLKAVLIKKSYHPTAVKDIIKSYKETLQFFDIETTGFSTTNSGKEAISEIKNTEQNTTKTQESTKLQDENLIGSEGNEPLIFKISRSSNVRIYFSGEVTQESIEKLINLLELSKDTFPSESELVANDKMK